MGMIFKYNVNIAVEVTILLVLVITLATLFLQKRLFKTTMPLIFLTTSIILMTIVHVVMWIVFIRDVPVKYGELPMRILYVLDYLFSYGAFAAFYYYVEALAIDEYERIGVVYTPRKSVKTLIVSTGIITTIAYSALLFVPSLYHLEGGIAVYSALDLILLHIAGKCGFICALIFLVKHRKIIGKYETVISISFIILISIFFLVDDICYLCIGHVFAAIFVFALYVSIDLHKGILLERQEKEIALWKTQIMLSQMQPHFLYNVLTTISGLCEMQNATEARDVVNKFADYFRTNLDSLGKEKTISFEKELEHIKTYLWLEKVRFEDSLNICFDIETTDFSVPSLTVQPIVENAVKHGIQPKDDMGTVIIRTKETGLDYVITVEDDGVGFDVKEKQNDNHTHVGIENVTKRLDIICNGTLEINSVKGKGTVVTIHIPKGVEL